MTITREINGKTVTIALTDSELFQAYCEEQKSSDVSYVSFIAQEMEADHPLYHFEDATIDNAADIYREAVTWNEGINDCHWEIAEYALKKALEKQNAVC